MPATSGSPTQIATSQPTKAALSNTPADQFQSGDLGYVQEELVAGRCALFSLVQTGGPAVDGLRVLAVYQQPAARWVSLSLSATGFISVANVAALLTIPTSTLPLGATVWVESYRTWVRLDSTTNAGALVADKVFASDSANFRWVRTVTPLGAWDNTYATEVYVNETTGNNEAAGTSPATALRTVEEVGMRIPYLDHDLTIRVASNLSGVTLNMTPRTRARITLSMRDGATVFASGTAAVVANPNPAGNTTGTITATGIAAWVTSVGKIIEADGGTGIGGLCYSFVLADSAGTGLIPKFCQYVNSSIPGLFLVQGVAANPAAAVRVLTLAQITGPIDINVGQGAFIMLCVDRTPAGSANPMISGSNTVEVASLFSSPWISTATSKAPFSNWVSCGIPAGASYNAQPGTWTATGGGCLGNITATVNGAGFVFQGFIIYGGGLVLGNSTASSQSAQVFASLNSGGNFAGGLGVFNAAVFGATNPSGDGVVLWAGAQLSASGATGGLYGSGNAGRGLSIQGARSGAIIGAAYTPTITGTGGDIRWQTFATAIPPLTAGAAVPAASALTTWANWSAAPFNRLVQDYATGCFLTGV